MNQKWEIHPNKVKDGLSVLMACELKRVFVIDLWGVPHHLRGMGKYGVRPSRGLSVFGALMGIGMLVVVSGFLSDFGPQFRGYAGGFIVLWIFGLLFAIGYHLYNATTGNGHTEVIENLSDSNGDARRSLENDFEALIRSRERDEISITEFDASRVEMLNSVPKTLMTTPTDSSAKSGAEERLELLSNLKAKGLISEEEFALKRQEMIDQL